MTNFKDLNLDTRILKSLDEMGFSEATPIQEKTIPFLLENSPLENGKGEKKDLISLAQTGTGKTAAFSLPILNQIENSRELQAIIICPTRELCFQISDDIKNFSKYRQDIKVVPVYGGERIDLQIRALKNSPSIVVGTPGRVHDLIRRNILKLNNVKWVVLDEADEMLDMGFKEDLDAILEKTPNTRQTLLFSATMSASVRRIATNYMSGAEEIRVGAENEGASNVTHEYYVVMAKDKFEALRRILDSLPKVYGILFCRTRREAQELADKLKAIKYNAEALHGEISQENRTKIMARFKKKQISLLVATDVAARGIDVNDLTHVINYSLPDQNESYTHRSGRTGRAQKSGISISLVGPRDSRKISMLEKNIGKDFQHKQVPSGREICENQINCFIEELENLSAEDIKTDKYFEVLEEKLKKIKKEDLIKMFFAHKFGTLFNEYERIADINVGITKSKERNKLSNEESIKINVGRRQGLDVKAVFSLINSRNSLKGLDIGKISLMDEFTVFSIEKKDMDRTLKGLRGVKYKGKPLNPVKDSGRPTGPRDQRKKNKRNFKGKRRGRF